MRRQLNATRAVAECITQSAWLPAFDGNIVTEVLERNAALRPVLIGHKDGGRRVETRVTYTLSGQPLSLIRRAAFIQPQRKDANPEANPDALTRSTRFSYDALNRLTSITGPDQVTWRTENDSTGRATALIDAKGNRINSRFDSEGKLLAVLTTDTPRGILGAWLGFWHKSSFGKKPGCFPLEKYLYALFYRKSNLKITSPKTPCTSAFLWWK